MNGFGALIGELTLTADFDGIITDLNPHLHTGRYVSATTRLFRLVDPQNMEVIALAPESQAHRIPANAAFKFIADDMPLTSWDGVVSLKDPTGESLIDYTALTSEGGGPIAVTPDENGAAIATTPVLKVTEYLTETPQTQRMKRGIIIIKAKNQSPAQSFFRNVARVILK